MLLNTKKKRFTFDIAMIILWGITALAYGISGNFLTALVSAAVVVSFIFRIIKIKEDR